MQPFYQSSEPHMETLVSGSADQVHLGLFFNRFFSWKAFNTDDDQHIDAKKAFLNQFYRPNYGNNTQLERCVTRQMLLNASLPSRYLMAKSDWHWVTGMGNNHPLESGFSWHHTLAMPYLPGSSVKGLLRSYCELQGMPKEQLFQWFGSEDKDPKKCTAQQQAGQLIFFDAIPCAKADILPDVMTPHSGDWQQEGAKGKTAPADWHDPIPVAFLVARNLTLLFSVALANHATLDESVLDAVKQQLEEALGFLGAGAKTATGYGTMSVDASSTKKAEAMRDERLAEIAQIRAQQQKDLEFSQLSVNEQLIGQIIVGLDHDSSKKDALDKIEALAAQGIEQWSAHERDLLVSQLKEKGYTTIKNRDKAKARKAILAKLEQS
jgi:CRISPR-associated protein Cmr6